ncbi:MAG TPA: uracil-DNA glycosylase [Solirubrobacteraceae bacterium]|nr:uracil-DNA glycosylase [Solirubrobacteraceae bacterium]
MAVPDTAQERRAVLTDVYREACRCERCPHLAQSRTQVVFGAGNADADLMFVGEAPGADEDREGVPFVGRAGKLLTELLAGIGIAREDVFIANVLKCQPPGNRNPTAPEIANCSEWLFRQLELIQPTVVVTLGNFATRLLRDDQTSITRIHGQAEERVIGRRAVRLFPVLHPASALYTPSNRAVLAADFALIPGLVALGAPAQPRPAAPEPEPEPATGEPSTGEPSAGEPTVDPADQLGLF